MKSVALWMAAFVVFAALPTYAKILPSGGGSAITTIVIATTGSDAAACTLAAPCQTVGKAQTAAQTALAAGRCPIVIFRGGTYPVASTLSFGTSDSGSATCTALWESYPGEAAIISGGVDLTGTWSLCTTADTVCNSGANGIYKSSNVSLTYFRELYVAGTHRTRSRSKNSVGSTGWSYSAGVGYTLSGADPNPTSSWKNLAHIEAVIAGGFPTGQFVPGWEQIRCPVSSISGSTVTMATPCWTLYETYQRGAYGATFAPWFIDNIYEGLPTCGPTADGQGCWYYDNATGTIYYKPISGETINSESIIAPQLTRLATFTGAHHIKFSRLTFAYNTFIPDTGGNDYASIGGGYYAINSQSVTIACTNNGGTACLNFTNTTSMDAALRFTSNSHDITFDHNLFTHNGGRSVFFEHGSQNLTITANKAVDNGGGFLQVGEGSDYAQSNSALQTANITIQNNLGTDGPFEYADSEDFFIMIARNVTLDHNECDAGPSICLYFGYGYSIPTVEANYATGNAITNNKIVAPCAQMFDCADIYLAGGNQPSFTGSGNYLANTGNHHMLGQLYLDDGTTGTSWSGDVIDIGSSSNDWTYMWTTAVTGNTLTGEFTTSATNALVNADANTVTGTVQYTAGCSPNSGSCPLNTINAAGIQAGVTPGP